jgi:16S rRNA (uracil1498-N3)-methyltransferase
MQRYFIPKQQFLENTVIISGDDAHHIVRVMRAQVGDAFICCDGEGQEVIAEISELSKDQVEANIVERIERSNEAAVEVWIAQSLPKGDKMETVIQKCTEIGAHRFIPFVSERTVVQLDAKKEGKRLERWRKIAKEAAEQAHRSRIPLIDSVLTWKQLLAQAAEADIAMICYEKEEGRQIGDLLSKAAETLAVKKLLLIIGPEGGFTSKEVEAAEQAGANAVGLGRRILRTETAAMVGLTCIYYQTGEMGGS